MKDTDLNVQEIKANVYSLKADFRYTNQAIQSLQSESAAQKSWREREITAQEGKKTVSQIIHPMRSWSNLLNQIVAAKRKSVLSWLYPSAVDTKHIEISDARKKNTGGWLLKSPEVLEWVKKNPYSPILWGYGIRMLNEGFLYTSRKLRLIWATFNSGSR